jgi:hypothetical protein
MATVVVAPTTLATLVKQATWRHGRGSYRRWVLPVITGDDRRIMGQQCIHGPTVIEDCSACQLLDEAGFDQILVHTENPVLIGVGTPWCEQAHRRDRRWL